MRGLWSCLRPGRGAPPPVSARRPHHGRADRMRRRGHTDGRQELIRTVCRRGYPFVAPTRAVAATPSWPGRRPSGAGRPRMGTSTSPAHGQRSDVGGTCPLSSAVGSAVHVDSHPGHTAHGHPALLWAPQPRCPQTACSVGDTPRALRGLALYVTRTAPGQAARVHRLRSQEMSSRARWVVRPARSAAARSTGLALVNSTSTSARGRVWRRASNV